MIRKTTLLLLLVFAVNLSGMLHMASADELPEGSIIIEDDRMPLNYATLEDGSFLVTGFEGDLPGESIHAHMISWAIEENPLRPKPEELTAFVAVYEADGRERWSHSLPAHSDYRMIYARVLPSGVLACFVQSYVHGGGFRPQSIMDTFFLDGQGNFLESSEEVDALFLANIESWLQPLSNGWMLKAKPPEKIPAPYLATFTLYDAEMQMLWRVTPKELEDYYTQSLFSVPGGYAGYAVNIADSSIVSMGLTDTIIYKLDENGQLCWWRALSKGDWVSSAALTAEGNILLIGLRNMIPPYEQLVPFIFCFDQNGVEQWSACDFDERYRITNLAFSVTDKKGYHYVEGYHERLSENYDSRGYPVIVRMNDSGTPLSFMRVPDAQPVIEKGTYLLVNQQGNAYLAGSLSNGGDKDKWYILPLEDALFTAEW